MWQFKENKMKSIRSELLLLLVALTSSCSVMAVENDYRPAIRYGSPQLYYSHESIVQRQELELLQKSNEIAKRRFELEVEQLRQEEIERSKPYRDEER
jgi:hypothetical protein